MRVIKVYDKEFTIRIEREIDLLWWFTHLLDKVPKRIAILWLDRLNDLLKKNENRELMYWFLRFVKDNNPFHMDKKIKNKVFFLAKKYKKLLERSYGRMLPFKKYLIKEPIKMIKKYW